jgi:MHS family shikimate/dehydroshikimate transporter-like MFS transporter
MNVQTTAAPSSPKLVAFASSVGATIEWYDFFIYGTAAALVFNRLFFPSFSPVAGTLAAFATFTVGFIARPLGGAIFGHYGDRLGRKTMLIASLLIMGLGTGLVGLLPTYDTLGLGAAVVLVALRVLQGIGLGGEWGGAVLMSVEHAPPRSRGLFGALPQAGVPIGLILATATFALVSKLPDDALYSWGWRLPFIFSFVLVAIGLIVRYKVAESPVFEQAKSSIGTHRSPLRETVQKQWRSVLLGIGLRFCENGSFYIYTTFILVYGTRHAEWSQEQMLVAVMIAASLALITIPFFGWLSDRVGRKPVFMAGTLGSAAMAFPLFVGIDSGNPTILWLVCLAALGVAYAAMYGPEASFMSELFPTNVRYSGISLSAQIAGVLAGGFAPLIATALLARAGHYWPIAVYLIVIAAISFIAALMAPETHRNELNQHGDSSMDHIERERVST